LSTTSAWQFPLKTLPRPRGKATRVIITEYDLPRPTVEPHDVIVDVDGMAWYSNFGEQTLGKLDPKTGKVTEYPVPEPKKGSPTGALSIRSDKDGNLWLGMMYQASVAKFDRKTEKFQVWTIPPN
jgi:Streptogramin lyase